MRNRNIFRGPVVLRGLFLFLIILMLPGACKKAADETVKKIKLVKWHEGHIVADATIIAENSIAGFHKGVFQVAAPLTAVQAAYEKKGYDIRVEESVLMTLGNVRITINEIDSETLNILVDIKPVETVK